MKKMKEVQSNRINDLPGWQAPTFEPWAGVLAGNERLASAYL